MKTAVIGVGAMGSRYAGMIRNGLIDGLELAALTRVKDVYRQKYDLNDIPVYESAQKLFEAAETGEISLDAVIIATPHYSHEEIAVRAFRDHLHVLCDKPAGVYSRQARRMDEAARESGCVYGIMFNQRALPVYRVLHDIVHSGRYGALKRVNWVITDSYRTEAYYKAGSWRATWKGEGGGVLLNQCSHHLDLLQWICGMPARVQGFCREGRYHDIEVEDDATVYMEWENGASGILIASTGDVPGVNRLEISLEEAMIIAENGRLSVGELYPELQMKEAEYRRSAAGGFARISGTWSEPVLPEKTDPYRSVLQAFADDISGKGSCVATGREGRNSLILSNGIYLSSWEGAMMDLPKPDSEEEKIFEEMFEKHLDQKRGVI